jgi:hypothetical protein
MNVSFSLLWNSIYAEEKYVKDNECTLQVMQFGRIDGNAYTLDFQYPFSALQAFAVALANVTQRLKWILLGIFWHITVPINLFYSVYVKQERIMQVRLFWHSTFFFHFGSNISELWLCVRDHKNYFAIWVNYYFRIW